MTETPRQRRRTQTREEIIEAALDVMAEKGVAALNLTEVARRVGLRQPSLYQYFDSRNALYDALFERGMNAHLTIMTTALTSENPGWPAIRAAMTATLRFSAEQPTMAQLLFMRVVPGFTPSEKAYAPSLQVYQRVREAIDKAIENQELHPQAASDNGVALLLTTVAGVASQQAANDPGADFENGRFIPLLAPALDMYEAFFDPAKAADWNPWIKQQP